MNSAYPLPIVGRAHAVAVCLFALSRAAVAFDLSPDPEPFRRDDEIAWRDYPYNSVAFLQRFSFRFRPALDAEWHAQRQGLRAGAGSTTSDEFYYVAEMRKRWELDHSLFVDFRCKTDEDFDGRYDRILPGIGLHLSDEFSASVLGTLAGEKKNIDAYLELAWTPAPHKHVRLVGVAADATFNRKSDVDRYDSSPFTLFGEVQWQNDAETGARAWANINPDLVLVLNDELHFEYSQWDAGAWFATRAGEDWLFSVMGVAGTGDRYWEVQESDGPREATLDREHGRFTAMVDRRLSDVISWQLGYHFFHLEENLARTGEEGEAMVEREEHYAYVGVEWRLRPRVLFWPGAYLGVVDAYDDVSPEVEEDTEGFRGKLAFPVEISIGEGATITVNPTLRLHETRFGGMNMQIQLPF